MTLRVRLTVAFFVVLLGPAVLGASVLAGVLPRRGGASVEQATAAVHMGLLVRCQHLQAAAEALALRMGVTGDPLAVDPPNAPGPWALCGVAGSEAVRLPAGTRYRGLAARVEVRDARGDITGHAYAVQPLDAAFLRELSMSAGATVTLLAVGDDAGHGDAPPLAVSVEPAPSIDQRPVALTAALTAGLLAGLLGWWLAGVAVRPLRVLLRAAERVAAGDLDVRSRVDGRDETGRLGSALDQLITGLQEAQRLSVTDALTGLGNVRHLGDSLRVEIERASRFGRTLGVLVLDLDHFKTVNDRYGHRAGDAVLVEFALRIRGVVREVDLAFRQGGEEFVILLPETDIAGSLTAAKRIGEAVRDTPFEVVRRRIAGPPAEGIVTSVTVSIGVAVFPRHALTGPALLDAADEALYAAKAAGRDRHALATGIMPEPERPAGPASPSVAMPVAQAGGASSAATFPRTSAGG